MKVSEIIAQVIKLNTQKKVEHLTDGLDGSHFLLRKETHHFKNNVSYQKILEIVGERYKSKRTSSTFGYFVEFTKIYGTSEEVVLSIFEVTEPELDLFETIEEERENVLFKQEMLSRLDLFVEILPTFPFHYELSEFICVNKLETFYHQPFRVLN
jgi:hypothetical protein